MFRLSRDGEVKIAFNMELLKEVLNLPIEQKNKLVSGLERYLASRAEAKSRDKNQTEPLSNILRDLDSVMHEHSSSLTAFSGHAERTGRSRARRLDFDSAANSLGSGGASSWSAASSGEPQLRMRAVPYMLRSSSPTGRVKIDIFEKDKDC